MKKLIFVGLCMSAMAAEPFVKSGSFCPVGYRVSGNYCVPNTSAPPVNIVRKNDCPFGYHKQGNYCTKNK